MHDDSYNEVEIMLMDAELGNLKDQMKASTDKKYKEELAKMIDSQSKKIFKKRMNKNFKTLFIDDYVVDGKPIKAKV